MRIARRQGQEVRLSGRLKSHPVCLASDGMLARNGARAQRHAERQQGQGGARAGNQRVASGVYRNFKSRMPMKTSVTA